MTATIFITVVLLALLLFYYGTGRNKKVLFFSMVWLLLTGAASFSGFFQARPPALLLVVIPSVLLTVLCYRNIDITKTNTTFLLAVHTLRLLVELVLYQLYLQKKVPLIMTFGGWNYDILTGISAIVLLLVKRKISRTFFVAWNIAGMILLAIIVTMAILSSPLPLQQWGFEQPNIALLIFPYTWLPAFVVPVVLLSHILAIRKPAL